ncbi:MAG: winged helix-turn-helix transcriptional regulator [Leptospiraceae bacterium]|nr:winged helix-turn-helix transcriptional regulator [Leptospiraceae bacterium]
MATAEKLDRLFRALADPTRRTVLEELARSEASVSELSASHEMALPSFMQHLRMLEEAGLVQSRKEGRMRIFRLNRRAYSGASKWLGRQEEIWNRRLDQLDDYLLGNDEKE